MVVVLKDIFYDIFDRFFYPDIAGYRSKRNSSFAGVNVRHLDAFLKNLLEPGVLQQTGYRFITVICLDSGDNFMRQ